jgi:hypothetical protein
MKYFYFQQSITYFKTQKQFQNLTIYGFGQAFKLYKRKVINVVNPILSTYFNLTIELPLKAINRGYSFTITHKSWANRKYGESKLKIKEMRTRFFLF